MTIYSATLETLHHSADLTVEADSLEQAVTKARDLFESDPYELDWDEYDLDPNLAGVTVYDGTTGQQFGWTAPTELAKRYAGDLLEALEGLVARERTEAAQCGFTDDEMTWLEDARRAIAKAKGAC